MDDDIPWDDDAPMGDIILPDDENGIISDSSVCAASDIPATHRFFLRRLLFFLRRVVFFLQLSVGRILY